MSLASSQSDNATVARGGDASWLATWVRALRRPSGGRLTDGSNGDEACVNNFEKNLGEWVDECGETSYFDDDNSELDPTMFAQMIAMHRDRVLIRFPFSVSVRSRVTIPL